MVPPLIVPAMPRKFCMKKLGRRCVQARPERPRCCSTCPCQSPKRNGAPGREPAAEKFTTCRTPARWAASTKRFCASTMSGVGELFRSARSTPSIAASRDCSSLKSPRASSTSSPSSLAAFCGSRASTRTRSPRSSNARTIGTPLFPVPPVMRIMCVSSPSPNVKRDRRRAARPKKEPTVRCVSYRSVTPLRPSLAELLDVNVVREEFLREPEQRGTFRVKILDAGGRSVGADHQLVAGEAKDDADVSRATGETECDVGMKHAGFGHPEVVGVHVVEDAAQPRALVVVQHGGTREKLPARIFQPRLRRWPGRRLQTHAEGLHVRRSIHDGKVLAAAEEVLDVRTAAAPARKRQRDYQRHG